MLYPHRRTTDHTENFKFRVNFGSLCKGRGVLMSGEKRSPGARGGEFWCKQKRGVLEKMEGSNVSRRGEL